MPIADCTANPNFSLTGAVSLTNTGQDGTLLSTVFGTTSLAALTGQMTVTSVGPTPSNTLVRLILVSGPGPTYTNEVILCEIAGTGQGERLSTGSWSLSQNLPIAGRPWSATTDQARLVWSNAWQSSSGGSVHLEFRVCNTTATLADCCTEVNQKLDLLLARVSKTYVNVP